MSPLSPLAFEASASLENDSSPDNTSRPRSTAAKSTLVSRNLTLGGHRTSVRLEPEMWSALREIARRENTSLHALCNAVAIRRPAYTSLTAAIRVFIMAYFRAAATEEGHALSGHGPGGTLTNTYPASFDGERISVRSEQS